MKFATKPILQYPPHLRCVSTLPWEIRTQFFAYIQQMWKKMHTTCIFIASDLFFIHKCGYFGAVDKTSSSFSAHGKMGNFIIIFSVFKIASCSPYWLQIKFSMSLFFYLFTFAINLWHRKFVTADITAVCVNSQHGIQQ